MPRADTSILLSFAFYLAGMLGVGLWAYRRTRDLPDFLLGGRRLGRWVTALSAGASDMSGWLLLGLPGYAYAAGLEAGWIAAGLLAGTYLNWRFVAAPLRRDTQRAGDALTLPEFFARRLGGGHLLRAAAALLILLFFMIYTSSGLVAGGKLFATVFGLPYHWAVLAGVIAILAYTFLGGFLAVCWTDLVQALLMALALVWVPWAAAAHLDGDAVTRLARVDPNLLNPFIGQGDEPLGLLAIVSLLGWGLGYFGQPHILARFMAIQDPAELPRARRIGVSWVALTLAGAVAAGVLGIPLVDPPLAGADSEKVFMIMVGTLLHPLPAGICLAAILAAIMSTADSQLLVSASALTEDFYRALLRPRARRRELIWVGRGAVALVALAAWFIALDPDSQVLELVAYAWAGFGAAFGPVLLLTLYWRSMNAAGALAGMIAGSATVLVWRPLQGGVFDLYEIVPAFCAATVAALVTVRVMGRVNVRWRR